MKWMLAIIFLSALLVSSANASLVGRNLDGNTATAEAYYDTVLNVSWLADAGGALSPMTWSQTQAWIASLNAQNGGVGYLGVNGWRLPTLHVNIHTPFVYCGSASELACRDSEFGYMFWQNGVTTSSPGPFANVAYRYWADPYNSGTSAPRLFFMDDGGQTDGTYAEFSHSAWAVHSGDFGSAVVPIPAAGLFAGALGLLGVTRRRVAGRSARM